MNKEEEIHKLWRKVVIARREALNTDKLSNLIYLGEFISRNCRKIRKINTSDERNK